MTTYEVILQMGKLKHKELAQEHLSVEKETEIQIKWCYWYAAVGIET